MDADTILRIKPTLTRYLHEFDDCFGRMTARRHLDTYVQGQLGPLRRKSIEPMADAAGTAPRTLQEFLGLYRWDESAMRDRLQQLVAQRHAHPHSVGIIDETSFAKKGDQTACVQRQYCGAAGKQDNCVVSVHLGYATPQFHTLLDGELFLPEETWHEDRERCRKAGIPDAVIYRSKWQIALEQLRRARGNGVRLAFLTFDEWYGAKPPFLRELDRLGQNYVAELPSDFCVWTRRPEVLYSAPDSQRQAGRQPQFPRLKKKNNPKVEVRNIAAYSPLFRREDWQSYRVKDGQKGPMVWKVKRVMVYLEDENGLPTAPHHLLVAINVLDPREVKYFLSNAPTGTSVETLLLVAFSRWRIERMFEDGKGELGLNHFEVRKYLSIQRHLTLTCVSYLFLAEFHLEHRGEKYGAFFVPDSHSHRPTGPDLVSWGPLFAEPGPIHPAAIAVDPNSKRQGAAQPPQRNPSQLACPRDIFEKSTHVSLAPIFVAL
ncbi:MAG: IS701 family transposase [Candidatus Sulfotelmatobacter sp.]